MSLLPSHLQLLLLAETSLSGQARAVRYVVRVRVLSQEVQDEEFAHDAQEFAAPRLERHAQAPAQDHRHQERAGGAAAAASATSTVTPTTSTNATLDF